MHIHVLIFNLMCKIAITILEGVFLSFDLTNETRTLEKLPLKKVQMAASTGKVVRGLHVPPSASEAKAPLSK